MDECSWVTTPTASALTVNSYHPGVTTLLNAFTITYAGSTTWNVTAGGMDQPGSALRYYSVYPTTNISNGAATTSPDAYTFDYTVKAVTDPQEDLIAAAITTISPEVELPFKHTLSQVNFAVIGMERVKIAVSDINVFVKSTSGTCTIANEAAPAWGSLNNTGATYAYTAQTTSNPTPAENLANPSISGIVYLGNGGGTNTYDNALMLMPQTFAAENDGYFTFDFTLTVDSDGDGDIDDVLATKDDLKVNLCDFDTKTWAPGKRYLYVIDFSSYLAGGPITFKVTVDAWTDDKASPVAETLHVAKATKASIEAAIAKHSEANGTTAALKTFPIAVATALSEDITITAIAGFDVNDEIKIEFIDNTSAAYLKCTDTKWNLDLPTGGRVVTLKRTTAE